MRSLIVEDNPVNQLFLKRILSRYGPSDAFGSALEGIKAFTRRLDIGSPYDLVCLDVSMEGLDGLNALKRIRAIETERGIVRHECTRICMVTSVGDEHVVRSAVALSDAYLLKPIDHATLVACLNRLHLINLVENPVMHVLELCQRDQIPPADLRRLSKAIETSISRQNGAGQHESAVAAESGN